MLAVQAIRRMRGGAQSQLMLGADGKLWVVKFRNNPQHVRVLANELIATRLGGRADEHRVQPRAVEITQATEVGTCYTLDELHEISEFCRSRDLLIYMDGARLANAAAYLGCKLADMAANVDALSFGGTKNGAVGAEAVLLMRDELVADVRFQRKQQMQLASKMRFLSAQFSALLTDDLWLRNAQHANAMARRLADGLAATPGVALKYPVQGNAVFAVLDPGRISKLLQDWTFHVWDSAENVVRWMTAFDTTADDVDAFLAAVRAAAQG